MYQGEATWVDALPLQLIRKGYKEESYFSVSHAPALDDEGRIAGVLAVCSEVTSQIIGTRRMSLLRELSTCVRDTTSIDLALDAIDAALTGKTLEVPFLFIYLPDKDQKRLVLRKAIGVDVEKNPNAAPDSLDFSDNFDVNDIWQVIATFNSGEMAITSPIHHHVSVCGGPWGDIVDTAVVLPVSSAAHDSSALGVIVSGVNPNRELDDEYKSFFNLLATQISIVIQNAKAYEEERKRADALLELDRQKTYFFSNVSHEFRTPLTLILGPLEDALSKPHLSIEPDTVRSIHRNAIRLLRLVNNLLDFSRIEKGRESLTFTPVDLPTLTANLSSSFRSLCETAGLKLTIACETLHEPAWVNVEQWEKLVLNLLSNAFKYTMEGEICVRMRRVDGSELRVAGNLGENVRQALPPVGQYVRLEVEDTGVGIPAHELTNVFERFHRIEGAPGRSFEGTGIGLSLIKEIVTLHSGAIEVHSALGKWTRFTVLLPLGSGHLPKEQLRSRHAERGAGRSGVVESMVMEATQWVDRRIHEVLDEVHDEAWLAEGDKERIKDRVDLLNAESKGTTKIGYVLIVDDNADMRHYLSALLSSLCETAMASNGAAALESIEDRMPDLVLSDVMMPVVDGITLVRELRSDAFMDRLVRKYSLDGGKGVEMQSREMVYIPVILLSARAGEDAIISRLSTDADDYVCEPFRAPELLSRIRTQLSISKMRKQWALDTRAAHSSALAAAKASSQFARTFLATMSHEIRTPLNAVVGMTDLLLDTPLTSEQRDFVDTIRKSGGHLQVVINDILDFSKIESGKLELEPYPVNIRECIEEAIDLVSTSASEHLELNYDIDSGTPCTAVCDLARLRQVIINLLSNSVKFTKEGHVCISVHYARTGDGGELHFAVSDTGIGIPPQLQQRLFQPFSQIDSSTTRLYGGTGLGLAVCKRLIAAMGGDISCESSGVLGEGSVFKFFIRVQPVSESRSTQSASSDIQERIVNDPLLHEPIPELSDVEVLIIIGDATTRRLLTKQATSWGMSAVAAATTFEAGRRIGQRQRKFDIVVMDGSVPKGHRVDIAIAAAEMGNGLETSSKSQTRLQILFLASLKSVRQSDGTVDWMGLIHQKAIEQRWDVRVLRKPSRKVTLREAFMTARRVFIQHDSNMPPRSLDAEFSLSELEQSLSNSALEGRRSDTSLARTYPLRILVAEDNVVNQKVLLSMLQKLGFALHRLEFEFDSSMKGHEGRNAMENARGLKGLPPASSVTLTSNGLEAVKAIELVSEYASENRRTGEEKAKGFDVVLLDVQMPVMDGLEAASHIRRLWDVPETTLRSEATKEDTTVNNPQISDHGQRRGARLHPNCVLTRERKHEWSLMRPWLVAVTANAMMEDERSCLQAGFDQYANKPLRMKKLEDIIGAIGRQRREGFD
ncbi:hypothetical protein HK097_009152 [Rhizophlyctis rosea]|uniref:Uncharacterized protein n=1 Tax=Rhizophlyctis rosea TaxID=64517 RepID=A0AAD5S9B8_9FUNG|nr:hypothetical protein HK097_009152 [Rhizophlyctis rosea]